MILTRDQELMPGHGCAVHHVVDRAATEHEGQGHHTPGEAAGEYGSGASGAIMSAAGYPIRRCSMMIVCVIQLNVMSGPRRASTASMRREGADIGLNGVSSADQ